MQNAFERSEMLWGKHSQEKLKNAHIAIFGVGGVGGHALECVARCGVGNITVLDSDVISYSNINRQILATWENVGTLKVSAAKARVLQINPNCKVNEINMFYLPENSHEVTLSDYDYIIDAIDTMSAKIELIVKANACNTPIISSMGCGNKLNPADFYVSDIYKTNTDPIAKILRRELKKRQISALKVVCSSEKAMKPAANVQEGQKFIPASVSFVPGVCGMIMASEAIKDILGLKNENA